jgi:hypothetical protein
VPRIRAPSRLWLGDLGGDDTADDFLRSSTVSAPDLSSWLTEMEQGDFLFSLSTVELSDEANHVERLN